MKHRWQRGLIRRAVAGVMVCILFSGCTLSDVDAFMQSIVRTTHSGQQTSSADPDEAEFHIDPNGEGVTDFSTTLEDSVLSLVNTERQSLSLSSLSEDSTLKETARARCKEMMENDYFEHTRPDGRDWSTIIDEYHYRYSVVSENLQKGRAETLNAQEIFDSWKESPAHYEALIASDVTRTGVGIYVRKSDLGYEWYATEHFAAPR
ncbi:MAG: CAP domain-containing protein [Acetanaerobacterium sp.]